MNSPKKRSKQLFLYLILTGFAIIISCSKDEESLSNDVLKDAYYARTVSNEAPVAKASASVISGKAPLEVKFMSKSTDDRAIRGYAWDFGNVITSSKKKSPLRTFKEPGTYNVKLTVRDAQGLTSSDTVTITINSTANETTANEAPKAEAMASIVSGDTPLQVDFTGSNSSDDKGVVDYSWDFRDGSFSDQADTSHTFNDPGVYNVSLTVSDAEGLTDTATHVITVAQSNTNNTGVGNLPCGTGTGVADEAGPKVWCWENTDIPYEGFFSSNQLFINSHCNGGMVEGLGDRVYFKVNPTTPSAQATCKYDYNYRAEIRDHPSDVDHPVGTEQWWGFNYRFEPGYIADELPWIMWQTHGSFSSPSNPMTTLQVSSKNFAGNTNRTGEILVANNTKGEPSFTPTGIVPVAGQDLDVVIHLIWGDDNIGLFQVWIDGIQVYNKQERTVYAEQPEGGYWKMGIYKWRWQSGSNVSASAGRGVTELNTSIGTLRTIMRRLGDSDYGKNSYSLVEPD